MTIYRLHSSAAVNAPGLLAWAINGAKFKRDRDVMIRVVSDTWSLPYTLTERLLMGEIAYEIEDGPTDGATIVFNA